MSTEPSNSKQVDLIQQGRDMGGVAMNPTTLSQDRPQWQTMVGMYGEERALWVLSVFRMIAFKGLEIHCEAMPPQDQLGLIFCAMDFAEKQAA